MLRLTSASSILVAAAVALTGCRCHPPPLSQVDEGRLSGSPEGLSFPVTLVGHSSAGAVTLTNGGRAGLTADVHVDGPFTVAAAQLELAGGASSALVVSFAPTAAGRFQGVLRVGALQFRLDGEGLEPLVCAAPEACQVSRFELTARRCVVRPEEDGAPCATRCVVSGACSEGTCRGSLQRCDDSDACTFDACGEESGCVHAPVTCPAATGPCVRARCDPSTGCGLVPAPDGTSCGPEICFAPETQVCLAGECVWRRQPEGRCPSVNAWVPKYLPGRARTALAFDSARDTLVLFGGDGASRQYGDTWELTDGGWTPRQTMVAPPARGQHAMAFDATRHRTVLFGGIRLANGRLDKLRDTWEWDGLQWHPRAPPVSPPARGRHAMAWDAARQRAVVFGGLGTGGVLGDTWEWDGATWTARPSSGGPPPRSGPALAWDEVRHRLVLFGGLDGNDAALADTWEWDGASWALRTPALSPPAFNTSVAMSFDAARRRVVLHGHRWSGGQLLSEVWEWDGTSWALPAGGPAPMPRDGVALAWDAARRRTVLFGGQRVGDLFAETWEWDGATWTPRAVVTAPEPRSAPSLAWDEARQRVVLFGGSALTAGQNFGAYNDTWEWDGTTWLRRAPATAPTRRSSTAMAFDEARGRVVLFGGWGHPSSRADTWEWDGTTWLERTPTTSPPARYRHALVWDAARQRIVLFGGLGDTSLLADTWEWDGTTWAQRAPATSPPARGGHGLSYDAVRQRVVLFGGWGQPSYTLTDTWEWDGSTWSQRAPPAAPAARGHHGQAYDLLRQRTIVVGADMWAWDGAGWARSAPSALPGSAQGAMVFDLARRRLLFFGSQSGDTWLYAP